MKRGGLTCPGGGPKESGIQMMMAFGFEGEGLGGGSVLREKRRCRHLLSDTVPWVHQPGQKGDDPEASQIKLVQRGQ